MRKKIPIPTLKKRQIISVVAGVFLVYTLGVFLYYSFESSSIHEAAGRDLQAIGELKIGQIAQWRKERLSIARYTSRSFLPAGVIERFIANPEDASLRDAIRERILLVKMEYSYKDIAVMSRDGRVLLKMDTTTDHQDAVPPSLIRNAAASEDVTETDFYLAETDGKIHYEIFAPIRNGNRRMIGIIVFRTDPAEYFYPLVQSWPTPSRSSETLIIRKDGDSVLYLNELRFKKNTALRYRVSMERSDRPAVRAVMGYRGIFEGYDYRGVRTLAYIAPISDTPWFMVAKVDYSEIFAELSYRSTTLLIMSFIALFVIGFGITAYYRSYQVKVYDTILETEESIRRNERLLKLFVEYTPAAVAMLDRDMHYIVVSRRYLVDYDLGDQNVIGRCHYDIFPDIPERWKLIHRRCLAGETLSASEDRFPRAGGTVDWVRWGIHPWYDHDDIIGGIIIFSEVITERKAIDEVLQDVQRRESIGVLSSGIAHDFNNLLTVMMGNVSLAQMEIPSFHPAYKKMSNALAAIESAAELTRQILAYSGKGRFQIVRIDIGAEIRNHASLFTVSMPKNVKLAACLPPDPVYVQGDPGQIKQIIMNLILNGADAIGERQGTVTITLSSVTPGREELREYGMIPNTVLKEGAYALLEVSDDGNGMSAETMKRIFDPFFTTKFLGRGLGLSAILGIIRGHEGGIAIESAEGVGSTFRILLPAIPGAACASPAPADGAQAAADTSKLVLVIDDEEEVAMMAKEILASEMVPVIAEVNPVLGIKRFREHQAKIGLVLLDLTMPELSGKQVSGALHTIDPNVRIIITSGYTEEDARKKIGSEHVAGFLQKPYTMQALLTLVRDTMK